MGRSQETFSKKEREKKRIQKRQEKERKREERKANPNAKFDDMIAYVDANGNLTDVPPDPTKKKKVIDPTTIEISVGKREHQEELPREGKVSFFNDDKGYGFIRDFDTQEDFFVHINGCIDDIAEGDKVTYSLQRGMKGMNAVEVKKL